MTNASHSWVQWQTKGHERQNKIAEAQTRARADASGAQARFGCASNMILSICGKACAFKYSTLCKENQITEQIYRKSLTFFSP
jgi:hypothetical protein